MMYYKNCSLIYSILYIVKCIFGNFLTLKIFLYIIGLNAVQLDNKFMNLTIDKIFPRKYKIPAKYNKIVSIGYLCYNYTLYKCYFRHFNELKLWNW